MKAYIMQPPYSRYISKSEELLDYKLYELSEYDLGVKFDEKFAGLKIVTFEEILQKFAGHTVMNVHVSPFQ